MTTIDPSLSLRRAFAGLAASARSGTDCPDPDRLWRAAGGELPAAEGRALVDHTVGCPACAEAWRLARDVGSTPSARPSRSGSPWWGGWASLAAAALAVGTTLAVLSPGSASFRDAGHGSLRSLVPEREALPRQRCVLRWTAGPPGTRYNIQVATGRLAALDRARGLESSAHQVPAAALAGLSPGSVLLWQVEAVGPDGSRTASATFVSLLE